MHGLKLPLIFKDDEISVQGLRQHVEIMINHIGESFYADTLRRSSVCVLRSRTFTLPQPARLPSAAPGNQILPPRPLGFITESLFAELNRVTSSHGGGEPPITRGVLPVSLCSRRAGEIISVFV